MTHATDGHPQWVPGPSPTSTTIIDLGDHPSLSEPSTYRSSAALREPSLPAKESSEPYYALDSSGSRDRSKKRKIERACDFCRRRKTKCDGPKMRGYTCTNCALNDRECTYNEASKPRGPPKAYVSGLEDRLEKIEALLRRLRPEIYFSRELGPPIPRGSWKSDDSPPRAKTATHAPLIPRLPTTSSLQTNSLIPPAPLLASGSGSSHSGGPVTIALSNSLPNTVSAKQSRDNLKLTSQAISDYEEFSSGSSSENEDYGELSLARGLQGMSIGNPKPLEALDIRAMTDSQWRFHGKSSSFKLISAARKYHQRHMDEMAKTFPEVKSTGSSPQASGVSRRKQFWTSPPWETNCSQSGPTFSGSLKSQWPDPDLAVRLIDMYFAVMNAHFPLLHRPTFNRQWQDRLFERDGWFACLCMSLFAVASRWCHDPRVLISDVDPATPPEESDPIWGSAGWKYVATAIEFQNSSYSVTLPPSLFEVQTYHNIGLFLRGTTVYTDAWTFVSIGLRKAQDIGAHRKSVYGPEPTVEGELWKRAYWQLVSFDAISSMILGRPCASRDEDFDLDMPLEVDDEYWENDDPNLAFKQPLGKPSTVSSFICWIKLTRIAAHALRTLYALEKSKAPLGLVGPRWREETVQRLNDAMGVWLEEIPEHIRWTPSIRDPVFASQAATLITTYYMVQIVAHRPFIPMPTSHTLGGFNRKHNLAVRPDFPWNCLAVCSNAAKATSDIVESYAQNVNNKNFASMANCCYIAGGVLLVHIWVLKAMERAKVVPESGSLKQVSDEKMRDVTDTLTKLMTRLEEVAPKLEVAAMWLGEIKESLPSYDLPDKMWEEQNLEPRSVPRGPSPVPIVPSQQHQYITVPEADRSSLSVQTEPAKLHYDYPASSAYPSQPPVRTVPSQNTPSTPQLYSSISSASTSAGPFTPLQRWEPLERDSLPIQEHTVPSTSMRTLDVPPSLRQGYIPSLRHYSSSSSLQSYDTPVVASDPGVPADRENVPVPLPPWPQNASTNPMHRVQQHHFYVPVKPEEDPIPIPSESYVPTQTPTILPPFYAPASGDTATQQPQHRPQATNPQYGQPWEHHTYRTDRVESWRDDPRQGKGAMHYRSSSHSRHSRIQSSTSELRSVGYETLYTPTDTRQQSQAYPPPRQY